LRSSRSAKPQIYRCQGLEVMIHLPSGGDAAATVTRHMFNGIMMWCTIFILPRPWQSTMIFVSDGT
jgi:hypothetical protein